MHPQTRSRIGIRKKVTLFLCVSGFIIMMIGLILGYTLVAPIIQKLAIEGSQAAADLFAGAFSRMIAEEVEDTRVYLNSTFWREIIQDVNAKYAAMPTGEVKRIFVEIDAKWAVVPNDDPLIKEYLANKLSQRLRALAVDDTRLAEIFVTDRFGGLIASSGKTTDFYQADEEWWQKAFNNKDKTYVGNIEFDESAGLFAMPIAMAIQDESGEVIGVCKTVISADILFAALKGFRLGGTGHVVVADKNGYILFHEGIKPYTRKILNNSDFQKLTAQKRGWAITRIEHDHREKMLVAYSTVDLPVLKENGITLNLFIDRSVKEVFAPLYRFELYLLFLGVIMIIAMITLGYLFAGVFVRPIHALHAATEKIMTGDWNYKLEIKTGDEIEQFADTFREMIANIKDKKQQLEALASSLEDKVKERTAELEKTNEAMLNILEDLTDAKKKLEEAIKIKSDFTATVSHELRTPLTAIKEGIEIVTDGTAGELTGEQKKFLDISKRNVDRLVRVINDILDFQKLEAGKMVFKIGLGDINMLVKEVGESMAPVAHKKGLDFKLELAENLPMVRFDHDRIVQVLTNLLDNAIKFTETGSVGVITAEGENTVQISVKDTGAGIKKEDMPKLFSQFIQLDVGMTRQTSGTGLGLSICREIIQDHKGKIWAESAPGKGSVFNFVLPVRERRV